MTKKILLFLKENKEMLDLEYLPIKKYTFNVKMKLIYRISWILSIKYCKTIMDHQLNKITN